MSIVAGSNLEKQLDYISTILVASFFAAIVSIFTNAAADKQLEFLGIKVSTADSYGVQSTGFFIVGFLFCQSCWRVASIVEATPESEAPAAIRAIVTHTSPFNSVAYFGPGALTIVLSATGFAFLAYLWWSQLTAVSMVLALMTSKPTPYEQAFFWLFVISGPAAAASVFHLQSVVSRRLGRLSRLEGSMMSQAEARAIRVAYVAGWGAAALGSLVGAWQWWALTHVGM